MKRTLDALTHLIRNPFKLARELLEQPAPAVQPTVPQPAAPQPLQQPGAQSTSQSTSQSAPQPALRPANSVQVRANLDDLARQRTGDGPRTAGELPAWLARYPILYVDDMDGSLILVRLMLERSAGFSLITTLHVHDALTVCRHVPLSLVISNVMMPDMDGFEFCRRLKAAPGLSHLPVMFHTVRCMIPDILLGFEAGAIAYMPKPVLDPSELYAAITEALLTYGNWRVEPPQPDAALIAQLVQPAESRTVCINPEGAQTGDAVRLRATIPAVAYVPSPPYASRLSSSESRKVCYTLNDLDDLRARNANR